MEQTRERLRHLVTEAIYHSEFRAKEIVISGVTVNVPIIGGSTHMLSLEREAYASPGTNSHNEQVGAVEVITNMISYIVQSADRWETPVYQSDDNGELCPIGTTVILIDRMRLKLPELKVDPDGTAYLTCVKE